MELLIRTADDAARLWFQGDVVAVKPDGQVWGREESHDEWVLAGGDPDLFPNELGIIRLPGYEPDPDLVESATDWMTDGSDPDTSGKRTVILARQFNVWELLSQPMKNNLTRNSRGRQHNFTANQVDGLLDLWERYDGTLYDQTRVRHPTNRRSGNAARPVRVASVSEMTVSERAKFVGRQPKPKAQWPESTKARVSAGAVATFGLPPTARIVAYRSVEDLHGKRRPEWEGKVPASEPRPVWCRGWADPPDRFTVELVDGEMADYTSVGFDGTYHLYARTV